MREVILYTAASIDGYIAGPGGNIDWLHDPEFTTPEEDYGYADFYAGIDTTLMGNKTYKMIRGFDVPFPYPDKKNYVFSRTAEKSRDEHVQFIGKDIPGLVRKLKNSNGKGIWLVGGGEINALLLANGLIDRLIITLFPVLLGTGIPMFGGNPGFHKFRLSENQKLNQHISQLVFLKAKY